MREWKYAVIDTSTNSTTVTSVPALVKGVYINTTLSAHTVVLKDDTTAVFTIPAEAGAGDAFDFGDEGTRFETSLVCDPDDASTGNLTILYYDLERS